MIRTLVREVLPLVALFGMILGLIALRMLCLEWRGGRRDDLVDLGLDVLAYVAAGLIGIAVGNRFGPGG